MVGLYLRVSTDRQGDKWSLPEQERLGIEWARSRGYHVYREAESGADFKRPELQHLLADIEAGQIDAVWVVELSRLARDVYDSALIRKLFVKKGVRLYVNGIETDLTELNGTLMYNIHSAFNEYERGRIVERVNRGITGYINSGRQSMSNCFGYVSRFNPDGSKLWMVDPKAAEAVRLAYSLASQGIPYAQIAARLSSYPRKRGGHWESKDVGRMLRRLIYAGKTTNMDGEVIDSLVYQPIVSYEVWQMAAKARPEKYPYTRSSVGSFLSTGIIHCGICGKGYYYRHKGSYPLYGVRHKPECTEKHSYWKIELFDGLLTQAHCLQQGTPPDSSRRRLEGPDATIQRSITRTQLKEQLKTATITNEVLHIEFKNGWADDIPLRNIPSGYSIDVRDRRFKLTS